MSCAMIYWGGKPDKFVRVFSRYGAALDVSSDIGMRFGEDDAFLSTA